MPTQDDCGDVTFDDELPEIGMTLLVAALLVVAYAKQALNKTVARAALVRFGITASFDGVSSRNELRAEEAIG